MYCTTTNLLGQIFLSKLSQVKYDKGQVIKLFLAYLCNNRQNSVLEVNGSNKHGGASKTLVLSISRDKEVKGTTPGQNKKISQFKEKLLIQGKRILQCHLNAGLESSCNVESSTKSHFCRLHPRLQQQLQSIVRWNTAGSIKTLLLAVLAIKRGTQLLLKRLVSRWGVPRRNRHTRLKKAYLLISRCSRS